MSDFEPDEEPTESPVQVGQLLSRVERIMSRNREQTEILRRRWNAGDIDREMLPCHDRCDSEVALTLEGFTYRGRCPAHMERGICPLVSKADRELRARLRLAGFADRYHEAVPEKIRCRDVVDQYLLDLPKNLTDGRGLILSGDVGVGKTMALAYLARQILIADHGVWCVLMEKLLSALADRDQRKKFVTRALSVEFLMLEDFGSGEIQPWMLGILEGIVETRYGKKQPTLLSTNLTREQLTHAPEFRRMVDRWRQTNTFVNIGGGSQRGDG